jgi:ATP-dependent Lon protease
VNDKISISSNYMLPIILSEYNFKVNDITFDKGILSSIIQTIENEDGVRNLRRALQNIISHVNLKRLVNDNEITLPYAVTEEDVRKYTNNKKNGLNGATLSMYT